MPKFLKSQLEAVGIDLPAEVEALIAARREHRFTEGVPAPVAHPLVESAMKRVAGGEGGMDDFMPDYEIIDDSPPPLTLRERRDRLIATISAAENVRLSEVLPEGRRRLMNLDRARIRAIAEGERSAVDVKRLGAVEAAMAQFAAIERHAAELMSAVEDLDDAAIDQFELPSWPA